MLTRTRSLAAELRAIDTAMARIDHACVPLLAGLPQEQIPSALNLLHYLVLRRHDLRGAQMLLATCGLSSLGRTESHVRSGLGAVLRALHLLIGEDWRAAADVGRLTLEDGEALLARHTDDLLGPPPAGRAGRIMVTMPTEASTDYALVRDLVADGMNCMRINCAHDGPAAWERMIAHLRRASAETGRACMVCMDIAGPKLRTSAIEPGPAVQKIKPRRDALGRVTFPAHVAILPASSTERAYVSADAVLLVDAAFGPGAVPGQTIEFVDARDRHRSFRILSRNDNILLATFDRTAYLVPGTLLQIPGRDGSETRRVIDMPVREAALTLSVGDTLVLTPEHVPGAPAVRDEAGHVIASARIGVTLPEVFSGVRPGEAIWFDDGRIGGVIRTVEPERISVEITMARPGGETLRAEKGINLPDTNLQVDALTDEDLEHLPFIVNHADAIGYSFVHRAEDVHQLQTRLEALGGTNLGIILKIETRRAFDELPRLLLACMRTGRFGVMIARGDLAIECGYERMAEVQEEILWIAEAAHAPVIWATQVLETLAKTGVPSRAEVTDAAMSERAECVMLNKGPYIRQAVRMLDDILRRMQAHQSKKRAMLRPLSVAEAVLDETLSGTPS